MIFHGEIDTKEKRRDSPSKRTQGYCISLDLSRYLCHYGTFFTIDDMIIDSAVLGVCNACRALIARKLPKVLGGW